MPLSVLITDATARQGVAAIDALLALGLGDLIIVAATENALSPQARALTAKSNSIKLICCHVGSPRDLFKEANKVVASADLSDSARIWGVFLASPSDAAKNPFKGEEALGKSLVDEALAAGVRHFVFSSMDRGGDTESWDNPTNVPDLRSKHEIEIYLRDQAANKGGCMGWTIFRTANIMENLNMGYWSAAYLACLRDTLGEVPLQWVSVRDVGFFVAEAFKSPNSWNNTAMGIAGDDLTFSQLNSLYEKSTGHPVPTSSGFIGTMMGLAMPEFRALFDWYKHEGHGVNLVYVRSKHPSIMGFKAWLKGPRSE